MKLHPHADIIDRWPRPSAFAREVSTFLEGDVRIRNGNARTMRTQGIPSKYWTAVVKANEACAFDPITYAELAEAAKQPASAAP